MSTITKERVAGIASGEKCYTHDDVVELARIALASLEAEPVALRDERSGSGGISKKPGFNDLPHGTPLYAAPPAPVDRNPLREFAMEYIESWDLGMAGDSSLLASARKAIADSEILQPAPVVPDMAAFGEMPFLGTQEKAFVCGWNACRAAMLQGAEQPQSAQQNIPENIPTLKDAVIAVRNSGIAIDGEKILAERDALNSPVIPDGWVLVPKEPTPDMLNAAWVSHGIYHASAYHTMLAAAPQQVK